MRVLSTLLVLCSVAAAQEPSFEALGQVTVVSGDRVRARERALDDALRQAVEQAAATVLDPAALVARSSELRLRIYPKARTYVGNYRILEEGETSGVFQVHVSAQVDTGRLAHDLAATPQATPNAPVASKKGKAVVCSKVPILETSVAQVLNARGVEVAPPPPGCNEEAASRAAQAAGAQAAVVGLSEITPEGAIRGTDQMAARAKVTFKLVESSGRVSADAGADKLAYGKNANAAAEEATRAAAAEALRGLQQALAARWPSGDPVTGGIGAHVSGLQRYADYAALLRALSSLPGVAGVEPRRFARGEADLVVHTASTAPQIAAALEHAPPSGVRVSASAEVDGALRLQVAATPPPDGSP